MVGTPPGAFATATLPTLRLRPTGARPAPLATPVRPQQIRMFRVAPRTWSRIPQRRTILLGHLGLDQQLQRRFRCAVDVDAAAAHFSQHGADGLLARYRP